jgi:predicted nucleic-acid-binding Zn-ribbon protein
MSETKKCPKCHGKMVRGLMEIETSDAGVQSWRIRGAELVAYVCSKCGYIEFYDRGKMKHERAKAPKKPLE